MKVLVFYLLDAISKNVYELYAHRLSSFVVPLPRILLLYPCPPGANDLRYPSPRGHLAPLS